MKARLVLPVLVLGAVACEPRVPDEGTFVGNPSSARVRVAPGDGLTYTELEMDVRQMALSSCDGTRSEAIEGIGVLELGSALDLPEGDWCNLSLLIDGDIHMVATADPSVGTGTLDVTLTVEAVVLRSTAPVDFEDAAWVLELGSEDWLTAASIGLADESVVITPSDPNHPMLAGAVAGGSKLYEDADRDGEVGEEERAEGEVMGAARA